MKPAILSPVLALALLAGVSVGESSAQTVPVTVTITKVKALADGIHAGEGMDEGGDDFYAKVRIHEDDFSSFDVHKDGDDNVEPFWIFTANVDPALGSVEVRIQIWDHDFPDADDHGDVDPDADDQNVNLTVDLADGTWSGDTTGSCSEGGGGDGDGAALVCWDISILSASGDADGDGLLDGWETVGLDTDFDGDIDLNLPGLGADPNHKDLFLEFDWLPGQAPTQASIRALKDAFAAAPTNAGVNHPDFPSVANPDGLPGITLRVDTGALTDPNGIEDPPFRAGSCTDGLDNGGDGLTDTADPDCCFGFEDFTAGPAVGGGSCSDGVDNGADGTSDAADPDCFNTCFGSEDFTLTFAPGAGLCSDGVDNGADGTSDAADPDCLVGDNLGGGNALNAAALPICGLDDNFYATKGDPNFNFSKSTRRWVFRYGISGAGCDSDGDGKIDNGGQGEVGGNDFTEFRHDPGTIMHELGHNLDLRHGGNENDNCKPPYVSVMNYDNQRGVRQVGGATRVIDYSPPRFVGARGVAPLPSLVENALDETTILDGTDASNMFAFVDGAGNKVRNALNQSADWDGDGNPNEVNPPAVNLDTVGTNGSPTACLNGTSNGTLTGFHDWNSVSLPFRGFGDSDDAAIDPEDPPLPSIEEVLELEEELDTTDVQITKSDSADPAVAGEQLVYRLTVTNNGPNPASDLVVVDTLPAGVAYQSDTGGCVEGPTDTLTCDLGELLARQSRLINVTVLVDANLVHEAGGPTTITDEVSVDNQAGPDPDSTNDSASEATRVIAVADLEIVSFGAVDPPGEILVGEEVAITLRKVIRNNGPSAPMDVELSKTATAPPDSTVAPAASVAQELALELGELRSVDEVYTISCSQPSPHTFVFTNTIQPLHPEDTDPNPDNNRAELNLAVECVVPVAVNIKPGSSPNSINLSGEVIPIAVLTTAAGEYDTPLDFDATTIDALSVRFGPRDVIWLGAGGAPEVHNRGHVERSYELDERTRDRDDDMVLHFQPLVSGLGSEDTEACVRGEFIQEGERHRFFGCDAVRIVP